MLRGEDRRRIEHRVVGEQSVQVVGTAGLDDRDPTVDQGWRHTTILQIRPWGSFTIVEELKPPDGLAEWMTAQGLGDGPLEDVSTISGGTQNIMLRFTRSGRPYVLRRGPKTPASTHPP